MQLLQEMEINEEKAKEIGEQQEMFETKKNSEQKPENIVVPGVLQVSPQAVGLPFSPKQIKCLSLQAKAKNQQYQTMQSKSKDLAPAEPKPNADLVVLESMQNIQMFDHDKKYFLDLKRQSIDAQNDCNIVSTTQSFDSHLKDNKEN